jgi:hypothetical protein
MVLVFYGAFHVAFHDNVIGVEIHPYSVGPVFIIFLVNNRKALKGEGLFSPVV